MNYWDKMITYNKYGRRSVYETLSLNPNIPEDWEIISREYKATDIDKLVIDGDTYTNYGTFQFIWEKSFVREPKRSGNGSIENLNAYATFITGHLLVNFSIMSIDDYRSIMRKDLEKNEFVVETYDIIYNEPIKIKMYFTTQQMAKLFTIAKHRFTGSGWEDWVQLVGVQDYTVELVGTNNTLDLVNVTYHLNPPADTGYADQTVGENDVYKGEEIVIGGASDFQQETFGGVYKFSKWNISPNGGDLGNYMDGYGYTINTNLVLYAQWESMQNHTLTFNYGIADTAINESTNTYETSRTVVAGQSIGKLPVVETPTVKIDDKTYYPYYNGNWYKTPVKATNSVPLVDDMLYWLNRDSSIYLIYDKIKYSITYYLDGELHATESSVEYNATIPLPQLVKSGYTFDGWYTTEDFKKGTKISGSMPPYNLTLYARWVEK